MFLVGFRGGFLGAEEWPRALPRASAIIVYCLLTILLVCASRLLHTGRSCGSWGWQGGLVGAHAWASSTCAGPRRATGGCRKHGRLREVTDWLDVWYDPALTILSHLLGPSTRAYEVPHDQRSPRSEVFALYHLVVDVGSPAVANERATKLTLPPFALAYSWHHTCSEWCCYIFKPRRSGEEYVTSWLDAGATHFVCDSF
jgi:hypothetical protein